MKTPTVTIISIDFGTCQIRYFSLRYLHTRLAAHKKKSKTCTFGGAGFKERETYLKICLFVGLWNYQKVIRQVARLVVTYGTTIHIKPFSTVLSLGTTHLVRSSRF